MIAKRILPAHMRQGRLAKLRFRSFRSVPGFAALSPGMASAQASSLEIVRPAPPPAETAASARTAQAGVRSAAREQKPRGRQLLHEAGKLRRGHRPLHGRHPVRAGPGAVVLCYWERLTNTRTTWRTPWSPTENTCSFFTAAPDRDKVQKQIEKLEGQSHGQTGTRRNRPNRSQGKRSRNLLARS